MTPIVINGNELEPLPSGNTATASLFPEDIVHRRKYSSIPKKKTRITSNETKWHTKSTSIDRERSPLLEPPKNQTKLPRIPDLIQSNSRTPLMNPPLKLNILGHAKKRNERSFKDTSETKPSKLYSSLSIQPDVINQAVMKQRKQSPLKIKNAKQPQALSLGSSSSKVKDAKKPVRPTTLLKRKKDGMESDTEIHPKKKTGTSKKFLKSSITQKFNGNHLQSRMKLDIENIPDVIENTVPYSDVIDTIPETLWYGRNLLKEHYDIMLKINSRLNNNQLPELLSNEIMAPYQNICYKELQVGLKKCTSELCISDFTSTPLEDTESKSITSVDMCHKEEVEKASSPTAPFLLTDYLELQRYLEDYYQWTASEELYENVVFQTIQMYSLETMDIDVQPLPKYKPDSSKRLTQLPISKRGPSSEKSSKQKVIPDIKLSNVEKSRHEGPTKRNALDAVKLKNLRNSNLQNTRKISGNSTSIQIKPLGKAKHKFNHEVQKESPFHQAWVRTPVLVRDPPNATPHGTPLPKRNSFRRSKRRNESENSVKQPVKVAKPSHVNGHQVRSSIPSQQAKKHELLLSAKNAELQAAHEDARKAQTGVEALTVLIHHLTTQYEPFNTPHFKNQINNLSTELTNFKLCLDESNASVKRLEEEATRRCQLHTEEVLLLQEKLTQETESLKDDHDQEVFKINQSHQRELRKVTEDFEAKIALKDKDHEENVNKVDSEWRKQIEEQHERHLQAQEQLSTCHKQQLDEAETRWKQELENLKDLNMKLKTENKSLKEQTKNLEQTLMSDKDIKTHAATTRYSRLQSEVDSLKSVLDMRNIEIHKLRDQVADRERLSEDLDMSREKIRSLHAKTEDLSAQMNTKSQAEREHMIAYSDLQTMYHKEVATNKRLIQDLEELQWKLRRRGDTSMSLPNTTSDTQNSFMRSTDEGYKLPGCQTTIRMNNSRNGDNSGYPMESPPLSPIVKGVIKKSTSVSFTICDDENISSHKRNRKRIPIQRSGSSPYVNGRSTKFTSTPRPKSLHFRSTETSARHSPSESSDCSSPTWLTQSDKSEKRCFLDNAEVDEYEEDEFVQVLDLTDGLNGGSLSAILGNTPTSISLSDSDASQCGSRLELTDSEDDTQWVGAGEAMIPQDNQGSSVVSSDSEELKNGWSREPSSELTSSPEIQELL